MIDYRHLKRHDKCLERNLNASFGNPMPGEVSNPRCSSCDGEKLLGFSISSRIVS